MFDAQPRASWRILSEQPNDHEAIERLLDRAFGADRGSKVSYRYRRAVRRIEALSAVARADAALIGAIRYWPIDVEGAPALLLGPLAIDDRWRGRGVGRALVDATLTRARALGWRTAILVGDPSYYRRFGFEPAPAALTMPNEDPARLMARRLDGGSVGELAGVIRPAPPSVEARREAV